MSPYQDVVKWVRGYIQFWTDSSSVKYLQYTTVLGKMESEQQAHCVVLGLHPYPIVVEFCHYGIIHQWGSDAIMA